MHNYTHKRNLVLLLVVVSLFTFALESTSVSGQPSGPTVTFISNETKTPQSAALINTTGGSISKVFLNATSQNNRWKAFVGNVSGSLTLDDALDNTLFDWSLTDVSGEVYATRYSGSINWSGINCSNSTHMELENIAMNHTNKDDNITATFDDLTHSSFYVGISEILSDTCFSLNTYVNSTAQDDSFEEIVLYDGTNETNGNLVYATPLEQDVRGFDNTTYDFQMILPEVGRPGFSGSTAYYFYVELS